MLYIKVNDDYLETELIRISPTYRKEKAYKINELRKQAESGEVFSGKFYWSEKDSGEHTDTV